MFVGRSGFAKVERKKQNLKFGGGFTTNKGFVHLSKKPHNGLETPNKG